MGTVGFDLRSALAASKDKGAVILTLGYNTAVFSMIHRWRGVRHFMNMDGVEWRRQKWTPLQRIWLRANEWFGASCANELIADHPAIKKHLSDIADPEKITVIPYGADAIQDMPADPVLAMGLVPGAYDLVIARAEPENSMLEIVTAYAQGDRRYPLVVLGKYMPEENDYHKRVFQAAEGSDILFPGAIYDSTIVKSLRFHARAYVHGHQVGGTNPSLVEALAAGNAVIAHRNSYNSWVAGEMAQLFSTSEELRGIFDQLDENQALLEDMRAASRKRHQLCFRTEMIMKAYENLLSNVPVRVDQWSHGYLDAIAS